MNIFYGKKYELYFEFLLQLIGGEEWCLGREEIYSRLFERKFYALNDIDANMGIHGKKLRERYILEWGGKEEELPDDECSVLEALISLAIRIDGLVMNNTKYLGRVPRFFLEIIQAYGLDTQMDMIDDAIDDFLDKNISACEGIDPKSIFWEQVNMLFRNAFDIENSEEEF